MARSEALVLRPGDRDRLEWFVRRGRPAVALRARALLLAADGESHTRIASTLAVSRQSVVTWRRRYRADGPDGLDDRRRSGRPAAIDPWRIVEATLAMPAGRRRWTTRAVADRMSVSPATVARAWRTHGLTPLEGGAVRLDAAPALELTGVTLVAIHAAGPYGVAAITRPGARRRQGSPEVGTSTATGDVMASLRRAAGLADADADALRAFLLAHEHCTLLVTPGVPGLAVHRTRDAEQWRSMVRVLVALHERSGGPLLALGQAPALLSAPADRPTSFDSVGMVPRVTMREVAADAGVSIKTVSNLLSGAKNVSPATRTRVEEAVDRLGYQLNTAARQLRTGRRGNVVLAVPEFKVNYFADLAEQLIDAAAESGVNVTMQVTRGRRERELEIVAAARGLADGVVMVAQGMTEDDLGRLSGGAPFVLLGENLGGAAVDRITISNAAAAETAMAHVLESGRRRVALLGTGAAAVASARVRGCRAAATERGVEIDPALLIAATPWHRNVGERATHELLDRGAHVDAIVGFNDELALGALRALLSRGVRVPQDIAVVGFDNSDDAAYATPSLTSIAPDTGYIARRALALIEDRHRHPGPSTARAPVQVAAPYTLAVRESAP